MSDGSMLSRLRRGTVEGFVLHAAGIGLLFLMHVLLGRSLGPGGYGTFSYTMALAGVLAVVTPLGWPTALMRFVSQYIEQQSWGLLRGIMRRAYQITLFSSLLVALMLWAISRWNRVPDELSTSLSFTALLLPFLAFVALRRKALQGLQRFKSSIAVEEVFVPLLVIVALYLFAITEASGALFVYIGAASLAFVLGSALLWCSLPTQRRTTEPKFKTRAWITVAFPMIFGGLSQIALNRTDMLMLGILVDMETVGAFGAATRIATTSTFVLFAVNTVMTPVITAAFYGNRRNQVKELLRKAMFWSTLGSLPLCVMMIFAPEFLLSFFGPSFADAESLLRILAIGQFINAITGPVGITLQMTGYQQTFALVATIVAAGNVLGNFLAIPNFGALGAAYVTATSTAVLNLTLFTIAWKKNLISRLQSR